MKRYEALVEAMRRAADLDERDEHRRVTRFDAREWADEVDALAAITKGAVQALNAVQAILARDEPPRISNIRRALEDPEYAARRAAEWGQ